MPSASRAPSDGVDDGVKLAEGHVDGVPAVRRSSSRTMGQVRFLLDNLTGNALALGRATGRTRSV
jgi:hypothetical protein